MHPTPDAADVALDAVSAPLSSLVLNDTTTATTDESNTTCSPFRQSTTTPYSHDVLIILDTETTGLDHKTEELIEVAAVKLVKGEIVDTFSELVKPTVPIRGSSFSIHHISEAMLADSPAIADVLPNLLAFMDGAPFAAHNAIFDYSFINEAHKKAMGSRWHVQRIDTLEMYRAVFPDEPSHSLSSMLARFGFDSTVTHRALDDALNLAKCYGRLWELYVAQTQWQRTQLGQIPYLVERYLRLQKACQVLQAEMSDLKQVFKLHFAEGGKPITASTGEMLVSQNRRQYEYDYDAVWPVLHATDLVERGSKINTRAIDKLIDSNSLATDIREQLKAARTLMGENRNITFIKPTPPTEKPQSEKAEDGVEVPEVVAESSAEVIEAPTEAIISE